MPVPALMLATDLDGTLVGDAASLARLNEEIERQRDRLMLVYVTGRSYFSVQRLMEAQPLLVPDFIIAGVGTSIHQGPSWETDSHWVRRISNCWSAERVRAIASFYPSLLPQAPDNQGPFKCSYLLSEEHAEQTISSLQETLRAQRVSARLIYSSGRDLDILPARAGKGNALRYLATRVGISLSMMLTCGDSGNDRDMLSLGGPAAMMANAQPELVQAPPTGAYRCQQAYAAGILEALAHYGWIPRPARVPEEV